MENGRPRHWDNARYGEDEEEELLEARNKAGIKLLAGGKVFFERSPKEGEEQRGVQEGEILAFDEQTGEAVVVFMDNGKSSRKKVSRSDLERLNREGSRNE